MSPVGGTIASLWRFSEVLSRHKSRPSGLSTFTKPRRASGIRHFWESTGVPVLGGLPRSPGRLSFPRYQASQCQAGRPRPKARPPATNRHRCRRCISKCRSCCRCERQRSCSSAPPLRTATEAERPILAADQALFHSVDGSRDEAGHYPDHTTLQRDDKSGSMKKLFYLMFALAVSGCAIGSNCSLGQREPCKFIPFIAPPGTTVVPAAGPR